MKNLVRFLSIWLLVWGQTSWSQPGPQNAFPPGTNLSLGNVTSGTTARTLNAINLDVHNALSYGADPTGTADSSTAINSALAADANGVLHNVYLPPGQYKINNALSLTSGRVGGVGAVIGQCLFGDNKSSVSLIISSSYSSVAGSPITMTGNAYGTPCVHDIGIQFIQPSTTATLSGAAISGNSLTATIVSGTVANGNMLVGSGVNQLTTLSSVSVVGSSLTATVNISQTVSSEAMTTTIGRANFATLASGCGVTSGCSYPAAIDYSNATNVIIRDVWIGGAWECVKTTGTVSGAGIELNNIDCGALNTGLDIANSLGIVYISNYDFFPWGMGGNINIYNDNQTIAANFINSQGITANNFFSQNGRLLISGAGSPAGFAHFTNLEMDLDGATIEVSEPNQWITITGGYSVGNATNGNTACELNLTAGALVMVSSHEFRNNTDSNLAPICVSAGNLILSNSQIINYNLGGNAITQTGGTMLLSNNIIAEGSVSTYTSPTISSSSGTYTIVGNTFGGYGGTATAITATDSAINVVESNTFSSGYTYIPPGPLGSYVGTGYISFTPTFLCTSGSITTQTGGYGWYQKIGKTVTLYAGATLTNVGTCSGQLYFIPPDSGTPFNAHGLGRDAFTGAALFVLANNGPFYVGRIDAATEIANSNIPQVSITYVTN